jgi:hypothetical protein
MTTHTSSRLAMNGSRRKVNAARMLGHPPSTNMRIQSWELGDGFDENSLPGWIAIQFAFVFDKGSKRISKMREIYYTMEQDTPQQGQSTHTHTQTHTQVVIDRLDNKDYIPTSASMRNYT